MTDSPTALVWFRQDLRLRDNTALNAACAQGYRITPVFILDDDNAGAWKHGAASRWWLHESLNALNASLENNLVFRVGKADEIMPILIQDTGAKAVFWNRCYEPWRTARDTKIKESLKSSGVTVETFKDSLLWEPWDVLKDDGTPYKVFTPYYHKGCLSKAAPPAPPAKQKPINFASFDSKGRIETLNLRPKIKWYGGMAETWRPGENGARAAFTRFLDDGLDGYKELRNRPDLEKISRLSPHLHFGEISIREVWHTVRAHGMAERLETDTDHFCSELGWREFSHSLFILQPRSLAAPLQKKFEGFEWGNDETILRAWQRGQTGVPIIDAGMRQLWDTGWMHNRVRMIVASFLVKNGLVHWRAGEDWFWDTLVDADLANNAASWQWVAGCGADAAPYFRIFNPVTQGEKFDPNGDYIRRYVPELRNVDTAFIHNPGLHRPKDYPAPILDLSTTRQRALDVYAAMR